MLDITHAAGAVIGDLARDASGGGLRIGWSERDGVRAITLAVAAHPVARDEVVAVPTGGRVFVAPGAAGYLRDKLLDVRMDVDGRFRFAINPRH
ncbi:iron-sulfur cluster biosynthesis protein [Actinosynnema sp. NPDC059797]